MNSRAQAGASILVILIIAVVFIYFLYYSPYGKQVFSQIFSALKTRQTNVTSSVSSVNPLSLNASLQNSGIQIYKDQPFYVILSLKSNTQRTLDLSIDSFGCSFSQGSKTLVLPPYDTASVDWNFSSSSAQSCDIQFRVCFPFSTTATFPFVFKSYQYTGQVPTTSISQNISPLFISTNMPSVIPSPPSSMNETYYIKINQVATIGGVNGSTLSSLQIGTDVQQAYPIYIGTQSGDVPIYYGNSYVTTSPQALQLSLGGTLEIPFILTTLPSSELTSGYSQYYTLSVSLGYTYCVESNYIPVSIQ